MKKPTHGGKKLNTSSQKSVAPIKQKSIQGTAKIPTHVFGTVTQPKRVGGSVKK